MQSMMRIRNLVLADTDSLLLFYTSLPDSVRYFYEPFSNVSREILANHLQETDAGGTISMGIIDEKDLILGHAFIRKLRDEKPEFGIGLFPCLHGQGWGLKLMEAVLARADEVGLPRVTLTVLKENQKAFDLYKKLGFEIKGERTFRVANDSYFMERVSSVISGE